MSGSKAKCLIPVSFDFVDVSRRHRLNDDTNSGSEEEGSLCDLFRCMFEEEMLPLRTRVNAETRRTVDERLLYMKRQKAFVLDYLPGELAGVVDNQLEEFSARPAIGCIPSSLDAIISWMKSLLYEGNLINIVDIRPSENIELTEDEIEKSVRDLIKILERRQKLLQQQAEQAAQNLSAGGIYTRPEQAIDQIAPDAQSVIGNIYPTEEEFEKVSEEIVMLNALEHYGIAQTKADNMKARIDEELRETGSYKEIIEWLTDYFVYPYAVLGYGLRWFEDESWDGNDFKQRKELVPSLFRVSPFHVFFTGDGENFDDVTAWGIAHPMNYHDVQQMKRSSGKHARKENIDNVIKMYEDRQNNKRDSADAGPLAKLERLLAEPENEIFQTNATYKWEKKSSQMHYLLEMEMIVSAEQIKNAPDWKMFWDRMPKLKDPQYRLNVFFAEGVPVHVDLKRMCEKPCYEKASYRRLDGEWVGTSFAEPLIPLDMMMRKLMDLIIKHMAQLLDPSLFIDANAFADDNTNAPVQGLEHGKVYLYDGNEIDGKDAIKTMNIQNHLRDIISTYQFLQTLVQVVTGISPLASGQTTGIRANNRSAEQYRELITNSERQPITRLYDASCQYTRLVRKAVHHHYRHTDDETIKGDADVYAVGFESKLYSANRIEDLVTALQYANPEQNPDLHELITTEIIQEFDIKSNKLQTIQKRSREIIDNISFDSDIDIQGDLSNVERFLGAPARDQVQTQLNQAIPSEAIQNVPAQGQGF